jgi:hypothetical protein
MVRRRWRKTHALQNFGSGGQGRNRTADTRIFSPTETPVRHQQAEGGQGFSPWPTEPPRPTEPIPNRNAAGPVRATLRMPVNGLRAAQPNPVRTGPPIAAQSATLGVWRPFCAHAFAITSCVILPVVTP